MAAAAGRIGRSDVFFGAVPAPFGFGLWTSHFLPALLGAPNVVMERFHVDTMIDLLVSERVTVLNCVEHTVQDAAALRARPHRGSRCAAGDVHRRRGGAVLRGAAFEERTGAAVLQFYGSNETGAVSVTTVDDDPRPGCGPAGTSSTTCGCGCSTMPVPRSTETCAAASPASTGR